MKTLQELYGEIISSEELKAAFAEAAKKGKGVDFLKTQGVETTAEELAVFLKSQTGELSDEGLDNVAGGGCNSETAYEALMSSVSLGIWCAADAAASAAYGHVGQQTGDRHEGRLCN